MKEMAEGDFAAKAVKYTVDSIDAALTAAIITSTTSSG